MIEDLKLILQNAGIALDEKACGQMEAYHALLLDWNARMDLTNVPEEEMAIRHYGDSLLPLAHAEWFPQGASLIDVGSGAGFPGLPLAIARPDLHVTLLDAQRKRCDFLNAVVEKLVLSNVTVLHARAEDAARTDLRESFDIAAARAVAPLNVLCEYLLPFVGLNGRALCWKGPAVMEELQSGEKAAHILGAKAEPLARLPIAGREHYVQPFLKLKKTLRQYPRKSGTPAKDPLGQAVESAKKER